MIIRMKDLSKLNERIDLIEKSQKDKKDSGSISIVVEGTYNPHEPDLRKALFCDDFEWEHTVLESGRVVSKFYRTIKSS